MDFLIGVIDFSLTRFTHPVVIIGLIIVLLGLVTVIFAKKFDAIINKSVNKKECERKETEAFLGEIHSDDGCVENAGSAGEVFDTDTPIADHKKEASEEVIENRENDTRGDAVFRKKDGAIDYYYIFKIIGLVIVIAGCLMAAFG